MILSNPIWSTVNGYIRHTHREREGGKKKKKKKKKKQGIKGLGKKIRKNTKTEKKTKIRTKNEKEQRKRNYIDDFIYTYCFVLHDASDNEINQRVWRNVIFTIN